MMKYPLKPTFDVVEIHTPEEIDAEVAEMKRLGIEGEWPFFDLRTEAYNRLTEKKLTKR